MEKVEEDLFLAYQKVSRRLTDLQMGFTKTEPYMKRIQLMGRLTEAYKYGKLRVSEDELKELLREAEWLGAEPKCDGGKEDCDEYPIRRFDFIDRHHWNVCAKHHKEVLTFITEHKYRDVFDVEIDAPSPPGLTVNYCIPMVSFHFMFKNDLRGLDPMSGGEKTEFDLVLKATGPNKIFVIKELRAITGASLKEAKDMADNPPAVVKKKMSKWDMDNAKKLLENVGASVEVR